MENSFLCLNTARTAYVVIAVSLFSIMSYAATLDIVDDVQTYSSLTDTVVNMSGTSELHITASSNPIPGCQINLNSSDSWFFLENIQPSTVDSAYLSQVFVSGAAAVLNTNVRVVPFAEGTIVIPHASGFHPLQLYSNTQYGGSTLSPSQYTYYKSSALGSLDNDISSFKLKRGYMVTFAENENGTGASQVYVAQDFDMNIPIMPESLNNKVSFVRVFPWRWTGKKGWAGGGTYPELVDSKWYYDWDNVATSSLDMEYIPMRHNANWNAYSNINNKQGSTAALGFNEPDKSDQANLTVDEVIALWPNLLASGLRLGSPATSDGGLSWLYEFVDKADALDYRVDFVAVHYYQDGQSISTMTSWLKNVHERTGRPLWITEWNDGCNWTGNPPATEAEHAARIGEMIEAMDNLPFVERYSVYNGCSDRALISDGSLTLAGEVYQANQSPAAYIQEPALGAFGCAYYAFENSVQDSTFYVNHGVAQGQPNYVTGYLGQAIDFDGSDDYVLVPKNLSDGEDFTFAAWVQWDGGGTWQRIFDFGRGTTQYMFLSPNCGGSNLRFVINDGSGEQQINTTLLSTGQWVHVAVTLSGDTGRLYVNGSPVATNTSMTLNPADLNPTRNYLGKSQFYSDTLFNGRLDEVHIAAYALTDSEITALYNGTASNIAPGFTDASPVLSPVTPGTEYRTTLFYDVSDMDATGTLTFSKIAGPDWLTVLTGGTLIGTPTVNDAGDNQFTIRIADLGGASRDAVLTIPVTGFGIQLQYHFEGNIQDSVGSNDGTAYGLPIYAEGYTGQAIDLDGTNGYVSLPSNLIYSDDVTLAAWIYWGGGDQWQRVFDFGNNTDQNMFLTPRSGDNTLRFGIKNSGSEQQLNTTQITAGQWVHVAVTLNGDVGTLYVNGSPVAASSSMTINPTDFNPAVNYIGKSQWPDPFFDGRIDDFRIYNYALDGTEIATLAAQAYLPSTKISIVGSTAGAEETGNPAVNSYDLDGTTRWANTGLVSNAWIQYDLGSEQVVDRVQMRFSYGATRTSPLRIEVDGVQVFNGNTSMTDDYWAAIFTPTSGRYVKITMTGNNSDGSGWFSVWETEIWASLYPPEFVADSISNLDGLELTLYSGASLLDYVNLVAGSDAVTFSKGSGPDWLTVEPDGTLSGVPGDENKGANSFTVRVENPAGYDTASMSISVDNVYSGIHGMDDLAGLAYRWLMTDCVDLACGGADLDGDQAADLTDLLLQSANWLASESLKLYLTFEEGSGTVTADQSVYARSVDLLNSPTWSGGALTFDGSNDYLEVSGYRGVSQDADRTLCARLNTTQGGIILSYGATLTEAGGKFIVSVNSTGKLSVSNWNGSVTLSSTNPVNLADGSWHHIAVTVTDLDADGMRIEDVTLYADGIEQTDVVYGGAGLADSLIDTLWTEPLHIGAADGYNTTGLTGFYTGRLDDIRLYDRALSAQEIQELTAQ